MVLNHKNAKTVVTLVFSERSVRTTEVAVLITLYRVYPGASRPLDQ